MLDPSVLVCVFISVSLLIGYLQAGCCFSWIPCPHGSFQALFWNLFFYLSFSPTMCWLLLLNPLKVLDLFESVLLGFLLPYRPLLHALLRLFQGKSSNRLIVFSLGLMFVEKTFRDIYLKVSQCFSSVMWFDQYFPRLWVNWCVCYMQIFTSVVCAVPVITARSGN